MALLHPYRMPAKTKHCITRQLTMTYKVEPEEDQNAKAHEEGEGEGEE